ncbi:MAG: hypothetical protein Q4G02_01060 [bacterium]|nr:hypothetical protein [bacterium]
MAIENGPGFSGYSFWETINGKKMQFVSKEEAEEYKQQLRTEDAYTEADLDDVQDDAELDDEDNEEGAAEAGQEN